MTLEDLIAREAIRELRNAYSSAFDAMDEGAVRANFVDDIVCHYPEAFGGTITGVEAVLDLFRATWAHCEAPLDTIHFIGNHTIELTGPDSAKGSCLLLDFVTRQEEGSPIATRGGHDNPMLLIGRYDDEYVRVDGTWKFKTIRLMTAWPVREE